MTGEGGGNLRFCSVTERTLDTWNTGKKHYVCVYVDTGKCTAVTSVKSG